MAKLIPNLQLFLFLTFISLLIILSDSFHLLDIVKRASFYITNPISFGIYKTYHDISRQFYFIYAARYAAQENKALKDQLSELLSENATYRQKLAELQAQASQEQFTSPKTYNLVSARPNGLSRYLKIDKGSDTGIKVGQAVVYRDNYVGKVVSVSPSSANIQLLEDPDSKVAAFSQGKQGRAKGLLLGQFGSDLLMDKILHEEKISVGDLVYSDGTEGFLPRGLILGKVTAVLDRPNELFKQAKVKPNFDVSDLDLVFVITD